MAQICCGSREPITRASQRNWLLKAGLKRKGCPEKSMSRDEFLQRVWQWKEESGGMITQQMRRIGSSVDWSRERFTMDPGLSAAVQKVFIQLYEEGLIYRGTRLVNWDPKLGTAISDLEVISEEEPAHCGIFAIRWWILMNPLLLQQRVRKPCWAIPL